MERRSKESAKLPPGTPVVNADEPIFLEDCFSTLAKEGSGGSIPLKKLEWPDRGD